MDRKRDGGTALCRLGGLARGDFHFLTAVRIRLCHCQHLALDDTKVGEVLLHPANLGTNKSACLILL